MPRSAGFVGFYVRMAGCVYINPGSWPRYAKGYRGAEAGPRSGQRREVEVLLARLGGLRRLLGVYDQRHELEDLRRFSMQPPAAPPALSPGCGESAPREKMAGMASRQADAGAGRCRRRRGVGGGAAAVPDAAGLARGWRGQDLVSPPKTRSPPRCGRTRPPGAVAPQAPSLLCAQRHNFGPCRSTELNTHRHSAKARTHTHTKNTHTYRDTNTQCHCMSHKQTRPTM